MNIKARYALQLIEFLANPDNEFINRCQYPQVLKISRQTIYHHFSSNELANLEARALELRRKKYASQSAKVDRALIGAAEKGDIQAIRLFYQRIEGWTETQKHKIEMGNLVGVGERLAAAAIDAQKMENMTAYLDKPVDEWPPEVKEFFGIIDAEAEEVQAIEEGAGKEAEEVPGEDPKEAPAENSE